MKREILSLVLVPMPMLNKKFWIVSSIYSDFILTQLCKSERLSS